MYHYASSGLDNVWLANGYTIRETPYGQGVSIDDIEGLHKMLALRVASKSGPLNRKELRFLRTHLNLSQGGLAKFVGVDEQTVSLWERNKKLPQAAEIVLRMLVIQTYQGDAAIKDVINRINTVERLVNQRIVASERGRAWRTKIEPWPEPTEPAI